MKVPYGLVPRLGLMYVLSVVPLGVIEDSLTSSAEKVRKHVEGIGVVSLTAFMGLQAFLCVIINTCAARTRHHVTYFSMKIVDLSFLGAHQWI